MNDEITRQLPDGDLKLVLQAINMRFDSMETRLDSMDMRFDAIDARLSALEEKVDRRLMETRPIWEAVLAQLEKLEERLEKLEERQSNVEAQLKEIVDEVKDHRRIYSLFLKQFTRMTEDLRDDVERRLDKLEGRDAA